MAERIWTAEEFEQLPPAEQDAIFEASVATELDQVPAEFLDRVRARVQQRIERTESPRR